MIYINNYGHPIKATIRWWEKLIYFAEFVSQTLPSASNTCQRLTKEKTKPIHERLSSYESISEVDTFRILAKVFMLSAYSYWNKRPKSEFKDRINHCFRQANTTAPEFKELQVCFSSGSTHQLKITSWNSLLQMTLLHGVIHCPKGRRTTHTTHLYFNRQNQPIICFYHRNNISRDKA